MFGSIGSAIGSAFGPSLGKAVGGGLAGLGLGKIFGPSEGSQKRARRKEQQYTTDQIVLGNKLDLQNQKDMFDFRMGRARGEGLTAVEMYGSGAAGAGGGTTGSGQTLGNAANQQSIQDRQIAKDRDLAWQTKVMDNMTQLQQTKMQTDASKEVAGIQAGTTTRGQDINKQIADNVLSLNTRELESVKLPQAAAQLNLSRQQLLSEINKTATSSKEFQTQMKQLSMGPANLLVELTMRHRGISLTDDSFNSLSESERQKILSELLAMSSSIYVQSKGAGEAIKSVAGTSGETIADWITSLITSGGGIESTNAPPNTPQLGSRMSEPGAHAPNMNYR